MPVDGFKWFEKRSHFNMDFLKSCNEDSDIGYFIDIHAEDPKQKHIHCNNLFFLSKKKK